MESGGVAVVETVGGCPSRLETHFRVGSSPDRITLTVWNSTEPEEGQDVIVEVGRAGEVGHGDVHVVDSAAHQLRARFRRSRFRGLTVCASAAREARLLQARVGPFPERANPHDNLRAMASIGLMPCPNRAMDSRCFANSPYAMKRTSRSTTRLKAGRFN